MPQLARIRHPHKSGVTSRTEGDWGWQPKQCLTQSLDKSDGKRDESGNGSPLSSGPETARLGSCQV